MSQVSCGNCEWRGDQDEAEPYRDFWSRVSPGEVMPAGDCPKCGAFVHLVDAIEPAGRGNGEARNNG